MLSDPYNRLLDYFQLDMDSMADVIAASLIGTFMAAILYITSPIWIVPFLIVKRMRR